MAIYIALISYVQGALQHFVGDFARLLHAVHNFMRKYKPSHQGHRPLLFPNSFQRQHFLLSYFKTLSVGPAEI